MGRAEGDGVVGNGNCSATRITQMTQIAPRGARLPRCQEPGRCFCYGRSGGLEPRRVASSVGSVPSGCGQSSFHGAARGAEPDGPSDERRHDPRCSAVHGQRPSSQLTALVWHESSSLGCPRPNRQPQPHRSSCISHNCVKSRSQRSFSPTAARRSSSARPIRRLPSRKRLPPGRLLPLSGTRSTLESRCCSGIPSTCCGGSGLAS